MHDNGTTTQFFEDMPEDLIDDMPSTAVLQEQQKRPALRAAPNTVAGEPQEPVVYRENCAKCGGTGIYRGFSTYGSQCFSCSGKGFHVYHTSPEQRAKARANRAASKDRKIQQNIEAFEADHPDFKDWWTDTNFEFALDLRQKLGKFGSLTKAQIDAARRAMARLAEIKAAQAQERLNTKTLDVSHIRTAFAKARESGIRRPKMRLLSGERSYTVEFRDRQPDKLYVKNQGDVVGWINEESKFVPFKRDTMFAHEFANNTEIAQQMRAEIESACSDPEQAAKAYGQRFGACSICGRELTDPVSIERNIGPICESKFFGA